jgi:hypothetical protein
MSIVEHQLAALENMSLQNLRAEWPQYCSGDAPSSLSKELLRLTLAYRLQEQAFGGLSRRSLLRLKTLESGKRPAPDRSASRLKPGTRLIREWNGKTHEVMVLEGEQYAHAGQIHRSLTEIARLITGAHWSGPRFFGLKAPARRTEAKEDELA